MSVKLESSDKKIVIVEKQDIKEMVTIQTMLESLGDSDEIIPICKVTGEILDKVVEWTRHHRSDGKVWSDQFFKTNLENIFMMYEAADYLELNSLLVDGHVFIDENYGLIITSEAFKKLSPEKLGDLLGRDSLDVPSEQIVVQSLETWISADPKERSMCLEDLLSNVRAHFLPRQSIEDVNKFLEKYSNPSLCQQLNFENKTPRLGYEQCIVALHDKNSSRCLKYLDPKVFLI